mmetsp:Transcript_12/g.25  ORF Transcript_12/g.25 Transcript_12/m.25 type:complete len:313 (-) Transcript_12:1337-2275(-)
MNKCGGNFGVERLRRDLGCGLRDVREFQAWHLLHSLRIVRLLLDLLQGFRLFDQALNRLLVERLPVRRELSFLGLLKLLPVVLVRAALHSYLVSVAEELVPDEVLEDLLPTRQPLLELREGRLETQGLEGVLAVVPVVDGGEEEGEALGEAPGVHLPVAELDRVDGRLHSILLKASLGNLLQDFGDKLLHTGHVLLLQVFEAYAEGRLDQPVVEAAPDDARAKAAVDERLVQRCRWGPHQQVVQEGQCKGCLEVRLPLSQDPVHAHHCLLGGVLVVAHGELSEDPPGFLEERLRLDLGADLDPVEVRQELVQ